MFPPGTTPAVEWGLLLPEKKRSDDHHVERCSPVNEDGRRKAEMAQNDQSVADGDEDREGVEDCGGAAVRAKKEGQNDETGKDVANSLDPHEGKGGGVMDGDAEAGGGPNRVEDEVDADSDDGYRDQESEPEEGRIPFQSRSVEAGCRVHLSSPLSLPTLEVGRLLKV